MTLIISKEISAIFNHYTTFVHNLMSNDETFFLIGWNESNPISVFAENLSALHNELVHFTEDVELQTVNVCQKANSKFEQTGFKLRRKSP